MHALNILILLYMHDVTDSVPLPLHASMAPTQYELATLPKCCMPNSAFMQLSHPCMSVTIFIEHDQTLSYSDDDLHVRGINIYLSVCIKSVPCKITHE
jgi:hypothetical protein